MALEVICVMSKMILYDYIGNRHGVEPKIQVNNSKYISTHGNKSDTSQVPL